MKVIFYKGTKPTFSFEMNNKEAKEVLDLVWEIMTRKKRGTK